MLQLTLNALTLVVLVFWFFSLLLIKRNGGTPSWFTTFVLFFLFSMEVLLDTMDGYSEHFIDSDINAEAVE